MALVAYRWRGFHRARFCAGIIRSTVVGDCCDGLPSLLDCLWAHMAAHVVFAVGFCDHAYVVSYLLAWCIGGECNGAGHFRRSVAGDSTGLSRVADHARKPEASGR